ncbi:MAG: glycosyltransferase family 4 protein [Acidobacteria bacterium]|nr:glycosyltransferase family 4 protein [Acidobacteriota bacterium]
MRILQVCSARTLGGGERHVADLSNSLARRGHQVYVALAPGSPLKARLTELPTKNIFELRLRNAFDVPSAQRLARLIREEQIEVVHAHLARDYPLASLAVRRDAQLVVTRHVMFPLNRLHKLTLKRVARVIAVSEAVARALGAQKLCAESKIRVIPNGIDLKRFEDVRPQEARALIGLESRLLVGTVGSLLPLKGHEEFIRAAARIVAARADVGFVIICGDGSGGAREEEYRAQLERLIAELKLEQHVRLMSWHGELAHFYGALDVYVSASHTEAFGLSIVEAMAAGRALVATATEGAREIVSDKETGLLVPVRDAEKLAEAVAALLADEELRNLLGSRAYSEAQRFSLERMVEATERVYLETLASS